MVTLLDREPILDAMGKLRSVYPNVLHLIRPQLTPTGDGYSQRGDHRRLSDVVQASAGGVTLQTLFVDEGFGSLDPEALDLAFRALVDLQGGGRLVGIISHVPELKERIEARLEVIPGRGGSTVRFLL